MLAFLRLLGGYTTVNSSFLILSFYFPCPCWLPSSTTLRICLSLLSFQLLSPSALIGHLRPHPPRRQMGCELQLPSISAPPCGLRCPPPHPLPSAFSGPFPFRLSSPPLQPPLRPSLRCGPSCRWGMAMVRARGSLTRLSEPLMREVELRGREMEFPRT